MNSNERAMYRAILTAALESDEATEKFFEKVVLGDLAVTVDIQTRKLVYINIYEPNTYQPNRVKAWQMNADDNSEAIEYFELYDVEHDRFRAQGFGTDRDGWIHFTASHRNEFNYGDWLVDIDLPSGWKAIYTDEEFRDKFEI